MYKIGINQNEKSNYKQKPNFKQEKKHWFKIFSLLFVVVVLIITTMISIIANNQWNSAINNNNSNNWNPNQDKTWEDYYKNNCPTNKKTRKLSPHVLVWRKKWIEMNSIAYFKMKTIVWNI